MSYHDTVYKSVCTKCGIEKLLAEFCQQKGKPGRICLECNRKDYKKKRTLTKRIDHPWYSDMMKKR